MGLKFVIIIFGVLFCIGVVHSIPRFQDSSEEIGPKCKWTSYVPCSEDSNCPNMKVCRKDGCKKFCDDPKPGMCPNIEIKCLSTVCSNDYDCPDNKKCCANGGACIPPVNVGPRGHHHHRSSI